MIVACPELHHVLETRCENCHYDISLSVTIAFNVGADGGNVIASEKKLQQAVKV
jgi:hypothetical protein